MRSPKLSALKPSTKIVLALVALAVLLVAPLVRPLWVIRQWQHHTGQLHSTIESLRERTPADVPQDQWVRAVDWTANLIYQDFSHPIADEVESMRQISTQLDEKVRGTVDLGTLRWFWDECEKANGGPDSYAIKFRDVKLMTKKVIDDNTLPTTWSLRRCTGLDLSGTEISDDSIPFLRTLNVLERLDVRDTRITDAGCQELRHALPTCEIFHSPFYVKDLAAITLNRITDGTHPILYVVHDADGDWQFLDGGDVSEEDAAVVGMSTMIELDKTIHDLSDLPAGWAAKRQSVGQPWRRFER